MIDAVYAQAAPSAFDALNSLIVPTVLIIGIMYFLMIRPQQKRLKDHQALIAGIRRGDTVVTSGGILGKVTKVDDQELQVEIADGVRVKVVRGTVSEVRGKGEAQAALKSRKVQSGVDKRQCCIFPNGR
jgi:preprotein translocase subunit YajC